MSEPRDDPEADPEPVLYGIVFVLCRCFGLSLEIPEASTGDLDEDLRRRVGLEGVAFSSGADESPMGGFFDPIAADCAASINCD